MPPKRHGVIVDRSRVEAAYGRALADEATVLALWPNAREVLRRRMSRRWVSRPRPRRRLRVLPEKASGRLTGTEGDGRTLPRCPSRSDRSGRYQFVRYRPSDLIRANLQGSWMPYAELLLAAAAQMKGKDFAALRPQLKNLGFNDVILSYFLPQQQKRRYFRQRTPASVATMIFSRRYPKIGSEEPIQQPGSTYIPRFDHEAKPRILSFHTLNNRRPLKRPHTACHFQAYAIPR